MSNPNGPISPPTPETPQPRKPSRPRPYAPPPPAIPPDYARFCEVHTHHRALWRLTYSAGHSAPYRAHHRHCDAITLAASDLEALDFALSQFTPPPRTRPYLGQHLEQSVFAATEENQQRSRRTLAPRDARCLHQMADDLTANTREHTYWTSAVRDAALEILSRIADLLGDTCGRSSTCSTCLRPAAHEGDHLDASGRTWTNVEEDAR